MNCMKKHFTIKMYIIFTVGFTLILGMVIFLTITRKKDIYKFMTILESYYLQEKYPTFNINVFSNHHEDYFLKQDTIKELSIKSESSTDSYVLKLNQIKEENETFSNQQEKYYKYQINVTFPIDINTTYQIEDAYLQIDYISDELLKFDIGSIIFYHELLDNKISIPCMKPVVNIIDEKQVMTGLGLTLMSADDITITNIEPLDNRIFLKNSQITKTSSNYDNNISIEKLIDTTYKPLIKDDEKTNIKLIKNEENHYVIPIGYNDLETINTIGFVINYEIEGLNYQQLIYPFKYFSGIKEVKEFSYVRVDN